MMSNNNTKHVPPKGRPLPVIAIDKLVRNPILLPNGSVSGLLGNRGESKGLHVANFNTCRSAATHDTRKPTPMISTALTFQEYTTRLTNNGDGSKRKASIHSMHTGNSERTKKHAKNKQDLPAMIYTNSDPSNDDDRKPAAKKPTPTPDGAPSTCPDLKRKRTNSRSRSVVSTNGQEIKREAARKTASNSKYEPMTVQEYTIENAAHDSEPVVSSAQESKCEPVLKTETAPASPFTDQAEASIPLETGISDPNLNCTFTVRRKAAKRTEPRYLEPPPPPPQNVAGQSSLSPQAEEIPARKKPRRDQPLSTTAVEATRKTAPPDILVDIPTTATPSSTDTVYASTRRRSRRQTQLTPIETSEAQQDADDDDDDDDGADADYVDDDADLSGPTLRVIPNSSTGTPIPPPTAAMYVSTLRRSRRQIQLPLTETSEEQLDVCVCLFAFT